MAARDPDEVYPFGYGKAEPLAAAVVALMLCGAAIGIALAAVAEIRTPHLTPAPWTLLVLVGVMLVKWTLSRRVLAVGTEIGSLAVKADARHHMSDAITSASRRSRHPPSRLGRGAGWGVGGRPAALLASSVITAFNACACCGPPCMISWIECLEQRSWSLYATPLRVCRASAPRRSLRCGDREWGIA